MKKIAYIAAALIAVVGCSKKEIVPEAENGTTNINLSVKVAEDVTKAAYDGDKHIKFADKDKFYAAIAKTDDPTRALPVASADKYSAKYYYSTFTLNDATAAEPTFKGTFYSLAEVNKADEYCLYGVFPSDALYTLYLTTEDKDGDLLTDWVVTLPDDQSAATQESWAPKANVMLLEPTTIKYNESASYEYSSGKEYNSTNESETVKFAHLFGYGKINFAGVPAEYENSVVKSVTIKATGDDKVLAGRFYVDVTKQVDEIELTPYTKKDAITLKGDGKTTVKDYVAWFAAKPGVFDVEITVVTGKATLVFARQGLQIKTGMIAAPTVNYKSADTATSHDVVLAAGETWEQVITSSSQCLSSSTNEKEWGPTGKKMIFSLSYPDSQNNNYGSYLGSYSEGYVQGLAYQNITGGKVVLSSDASFSGISVVKANLGIYTNNVTADFTVSLVDGETVTKLGTVNISGSNANTKGANYYFKNPEGKKGNFVLTVDNFSDTNCRPYLGSLTFNPAPEIVLSETAVKIAKDAGTASVDCAVYSADADPTVSVSADAASWLTANYADGKVNYTVTENAGSKRVGEITVTAKGLSETTAVITVTQASATAVEYTLTVTAADVHTAIVAALAGGEATDSYTLLTASFNAKSASGTTLAVPLTFTQINYATATDDIFKIKTNGSNKAEIKCTSSIGEISKFVVIADYQAKTGNYDECRMRLSTDGTTWNDPVAADRNTVKGDDGYWTNTVLNSNDAYNWFNIQSLWGTLTIKSFEVTFVAE